MAELQLKKLLEYKSGVTTWNIGKEKSIIYQLVIGDKSYVGTTYEPRNRLNLHLGSLLNRKHHNNLIQSQFDKVEAFAVYLLEECNMQDRYDREKFYIYKISPKLNQEDYIKKWYASNDVKNKEFLFLGTLIYKVRTKKRLTLKDVGNATNIKWRDIRDFEKGKLIISKESINHVLKALGLTAMESNGVYCVTHFGKWGYKYLIC